MYNLVSVRTSLLEQKQCQEKESSSSSKPRVYNNILEVVGNTPLVKLNKIPKLHGLSCEIYAKCEFLNPGGSVKDRTALAMVEDAQKTGAVKKNTVFLEPTSGNTGIGIAMSAALMDNECTIVTGAKNSAEKINTMRLLGAKVLQVKTEEIDVAHEMKKENPDKYLILNQFENIMNPMVHYEKTGTEIISALDKVDMVVLGAGTGGTMSGLGLRIKQKHPDCTLVVGEPDGSIMINTKGKEHPFLVEGIGGGTWVPKVLDKSLVDHVEEVTDQESFLMARELAKQEGLLCGGSSGTAMCAAIKAAKALNLGAGKCVVVLLPDGIRNYMTKFVSDQWMEARLFMDPPKHSMQWWNKPITDLKLGHKYPLLKKTVSCDLVLTAMKDCSIAVIIDENGHFVGAVSKDSFRTFATNPTNEDTENFNFKDPVSDHLIKECYTLAENGKKGMPTIGLLSRILDITPFVVIGREGHDSKDYFEPKGVVTGDDVLDYIRQMSDSCNTQCRGWANK